MKDDREKWYFWFRQTSPRPPGAWVIGGEYDTYDEAKRGREKAKAWDAEVSNVFSAKSREDAQTKPQL